MTTNSTHKLPTRVPLIDYFGEPSPRKYYVLHPNTYGPGEIDAMRKVIDKEYDELSPTRQLILELLIARWRLGENLWTFDSRLTPQLKYLQEHDWITLMSGMVENTVRARLTDKGIFGMGIASTKGPDSAREPWGQYD